MTALLDRNGLPIAALGPGGRMRRAFTAVELLVATALAAMLMVALLGVLQAMIRAEKTLLDRQPTEAWHARFADQLEWDLRNSQALRTTPEGVSFEGRAGRNSTDGTSVHCRAIIRYFVAQQGESRCLVREETHPDERNLRNRTWQLVAVDVDRFLIVPSAGASIRDQVSALTPASIQDGPLPPQVTVALFKEGIADALFVQSFVLR